MFQLLLSVNFLQHVTLLMITVVSGYCKQFWKIIIRFNREITLWVVLLQRSLLTSCSLNQTRLKESEKTDVFLIDVTESFAITKSPISDEKLRENSRILQVITLLNRKYVIMT